MQIHRKKLNRYEKREANRIKLRDSLAGSGRYVYRNNTAGTLDLPKGVKNIPPGGEFEGDDYYMQYVSMHELTFVREIAGSDPKGNMSEEKLILDQPDTVKVGGKVEQVVTPQKAKSKRLNESRPAKNEPVDDVLLTENPLDGVQILG